MPSGPRPAPPRDPRSGVSDLSSSRSPARSAAPGGGASPGPSVLALVFVTPLRFPRAVRRIPVRIGGVEGAAPPWLDGPAGVLARLGGGAEFGEVRVQATLELTLSAPDDLLESGVAALLAQPLELVVGVEDEGRPGEAAREAGAR